MDQNIEVINIVKKEVESIMSKSVKTQTVRNISSNTFKMIKDKNINNFLNLCEQLLSERKWAYDIIAYDWAFRVRKQYTKDVFQTFEKWLFDYVDDWGNCDDFCTHAFGELLSQYNELFEDVVRWTKHPKFAVRRASAVVLIYPIRHDKYSNINPFIISDTLLNDDHYLVLKGYGWMLKVLYEREPVKVYEYLKTNKDLMPRISFRYALEKADSKTKKELMGL